MDAQNALFISHWFYNRTKSSLHLNIMDASDVWSMYDSLMLKNKEKVEKNGR